MSHPLFKKICLVLSSSLLLLPLCASANTTITNTVSVSADSAGVSQAAVTTVLNGEVVENWSETSSSTISYSKTNTTDATTNTVTIATEPSQDGEKRAILEALIARLQALINLYVTLNHQ